MDERKEGSKEKKEKLRNKGKKEEKMDEKR